jgi:asparagine synthase (glutamine-hydrolysing)
MVERQLMPDAPPSPAEARPPDCDTRQSFENALNMDRSVLGLVLGEARWNGESAPADWQEALDSASPAAAAASARGPFAVAASLPGGRTCLAVDAFARHTVCWRVDASGLRFAERADALGSGALDPQAIHDYLFFHVVPSPRTIFRGVQRVPACHVGVFDGRTMRVEPYRRAVFQTDRTRSFAALKAEFRTLLRQAVRREVEAGVPACFLSGGTDSSTVAGQIKEVAGEVHTYSIGFEAEGYDEMAYARVAARHFGARHHEYYVTPDDLVRGIAHVAAAYDQPFGNSSALPAYYCAVRAREDGVTKLLAGDGGDELFGGNSRYATQWLYGLYGTLPAALRGLLIEPMLSMPGLERVPLLRKARNYVRDAKIPAFERMHSYNLLLRLGLDEVVTPAFRAAVRPEVTLEQQQAVWELADATSEIDRQLAYDWRYTLAESDLPKVCGTARLAGLRVGYPMLDEDLVAFSMALPPEYKLRGFQLRWFFKAALRDFLPREIITKKKKGFGLPFGVWATRHDGLLSLATDSVRAFATRGVVRPDFATRLLDQLLPTHPGYYGEMVWILMMFEQWLRHHAPNWRFEG